MSRWVYPPRTEGLSSRQAHTDIPDNCYERELGQDGFNGPATHMYHRHSPCDWTSAEGPLSHHAFNTLQLDEYYDTPWDAAELLENDTIRVRFWRCKTAMQHLARNADGDELIFIHAGTAAFFCDYGHMDITEGDLILIPRGTQWRIEPSQEILALLIESTRDHFRLPDKGLVGQHAIFDPAVLDVPAINETFRAQQNEEPTQVQIKHNNQLSTLQYPFNPLDAVGWHGNLMPVRLNWRDIRPLMSHRYHVPPSAHTLFLCNSFMISAFVPRPLESDPGALRVPFYHNNDDYDEVIFYHKGNFFSRDNIDAGMMTYHPAGLPHGPHPKAYQAGKKFERRETDEVAIMLDINRPLTVTDTARSIEIENYMDAWKPVDK